MILIVLITDNVVAVNPLLPEDSKLLLLPFGGAVLEKIGVSEPEVDAILEDVRRDYMDDKTDDSNAKNRAFFGFINLFRRKSAFPLVPPSSSKSVAPLSPVIETPTKYSNESVSVPQFEDSEENEELH